MKSLQVPRKRAKFYTQAGILLVFKPSGMGNGSSFISLVSGFSNSPNKACLYGVLAVTLLVHWGRTVLPRGADVGVLQ